ncbi:MAG: hypothetical protein AAGA61_03925 [Pseudomonadota bacterium]
MLVLMAGKPIEAVLTTILACSACGGNVAPQAREPTAPDDLRAEVEQMVADFVEREPMKGFLHDMPLSVAYQWQDVFIEAAEESLGGVVGYKTGGHDSGPGFTYFPPNGIRGAILAGMLRQSGTPVSPSETRRGFLEADFAVRVGSASINTAVTDLELLAGLDAIVPFAEIPDPYYEDGTRSVNGTVAANMGSRYSYIGEPVPIEATAAWLQRMDNFSFAVHNEHGDELNRGNIAGWYRPLDVIRWLRDSLVADGKQLAPGDLMSLGNIGIIHQLHENSPRGPAYPYDEFTLSYYGLGEAPAVVTIRIQR